MSVDLTQFDTEELVHLAVRAIQQDEHDKSLSYLKAALAQSPQDPMANFLIGAEYAELSIFERALQHLDIAVEQAPDFHIARFQLGLLQLNLNQIESALLSWRPLNDLAAEHYLNLFQQGLTALSQGNLLQAKQLLQAGIVQNQENLPLNGNMQDIVHNIEAALSDQSSAQSAEVPLKPDAPQTVKLDEDDQSQTTSIPDKQVQPNQLFMSIYNKGD